MSTTEFQTQFLQLKALLMNFAYTLTKDHENAQDLYQETAYRALKNRRLFRTGTNFKAWTMTIMRNVFINEYRRKRRANTIFDSSDNQHILNSSKLSITNDGDANILSDKLGEMIDSLEEGLRVPFTMHYQGYKYQEIADFMELPLGTVKSRIFFARKALQKNVRSEYGNAFG